MREKKMSVKYLTSLFLCLLIAACSNTKVTSSWLEAEPAKPYKHPMIIAISDSQQTRRIYENHFVSELKKQGITATPSYTLINSKQEMNRDTVINAVAGTKIDAVLMTYLVAADRENRHHDSPLNPGYSGSADTNQVSATMITTRGRTSTTEIIGLKNDLYDVASHKLIWSTQTRTVAPESIDSVIIEVTALLIDQLQDDDILK